jgi:hypothetical protein
MVTEGREETNIIKWNMASLKTKCLTCSIPMFKISYGVLNTRSYNKTNGFIWRNFGKNIRKEVQQMSRVHL